jgi:HEAT repeat protein
MNPQTLAMLALALGAGLIAASPAQGWDEVIDTVMHHNPEVPMPRPVTVYPKGLETIWLEALRRPEAEYQRQAALTIALAHRHRIKGLEIAVAPLLETLERPDQHLSARLAVVRALIELDAREAAPRLFALSQSGNRDLRDLIEPAIARWDYKPMRAVWLERLAGERAGSPPPLASDGVLLAVQGLGLVREEKAIPALLDLVLPRRVSSPIRLEAARALGEIRTSGSEKDARKLISDAGTQGFIARLAAAALLRHHQGEDSVRLLQELASDPEPAVSVTALPRLIEIDPKLVVPALGHLLASYDAKVRSFAIEVLLRRAAGSDRGADGVDHLRLLADRLNDPHPELRVKARKALRELAGMAEYRERVIQQGMRIVVGADWRGQEQAALLLVQLDHKPVAPRLVALLKSDRPEVMVAVAWGLRRLAVAETLPGALDYFQDLYQRLVRPEKASSQRSLPIEAADQQLSQLAQFFGQSRYRPADAALRQLVPRFVRQPQIPGHGQPEARIAAIWALGLIYEGQPDPSLVKAFEERLSDAGSFMIPPEHYQVRSKSAISLGRMKAKEALPALRRFCPDRKPTTFLVNNACGWAIEQLTGEIMLPPGTVEVRAEPFKNFLLHLEP